MTYDIDLLKRIIGNTYLKKLRAKNIMSVFDFFLILPKKYVRVHDFKTLAQLQEGYYVNVTGRVRVCYRTNYVMACEITDGTGTLQLLFYNPPRPTVQRLYQGQQHNIHFIGLATKNARGKLELVQPLLWTEKQTFKFLPIYRTKHGVPGAHYYHVFHQLGVFDDPQQREYFIPSIRTKYALMDINTALKELHWPSAVDIDTFKRNIAQARARLELEEVLAYFAYGQQNRTSANDKNAFFSIQVDYRAHQKFIAALPFQLTADQSQAIADILHDFAHHKKPMLRLLQGDVGCGKTVVIAAAVLQVHLNNHQTFLLVPTVILAEQHQKTLQQLLAPFNVPIVVLAGKLSRSVKRQRLAAISNHPHAIIIGTQMLMTAMQSYSKAAMVVIDEQHRFGVLTRNELMTKIEQATQTRPHSLFLTATAIPRTLMMVYLNHIESSVIHELPPQRKKVTTLVMSMAKRLSLINTLKSAVAAGHQIYWVCLSIDKHQQDHRGVLAAYELLQSTWGETLKIGFIHGQLPLSVIETNLQKFSQRALDILVTTTIVEVGVDIPGATIMVVEDADYFGLAQLHQLRGRVGRGATQSYCILLYSAGCKPTSRHRLQIMRHEHSGHKLAEIDLKTRGYGNFLGTEQSGMGQWKIVQWTKITQYLPTVQKITPELDSDTLHKIFHRWLPLA